VQLVLHKAAVAICRHNYIVGTIAALCRTRVEPISETKKNGSSDDPLKVARKQQTIFYLKISSRAAVIVIGPDLRYCLRVIRAGLGFGVINLMHFTAHYYSDID